MFSFVKDLFKKATNEIQFANESINETKEYINKLVTSPVNDYQRKIDEICTSFNIIEQEIIDLETHVVKSGKRLGLLDGVDLENISLFGNNQEEYVSLETEVDSILTTTSQEEYFNLINMSSLSDEDKEQAKNLYVDGNKRASIAIFIRSDYDKQIEAKEIEIYNLEEAMKNEGDGIYWNRYKEYILNSTDDPKTLASKIENDPILKETMEVLQPYLDELEKKEQELYGLQNERYVVNCSIKVWSFDYLDEVVKTEDFKEKSTNTASIDLLIKDLEGRYTYNGGVITESDYQDACKSLGINPDTVNKILLWESMRESDVLGRYFTEGGITEEDMANWGLLTDFNTESSLEARGTIYLTDEEKAKYNYLYETEGAERATEYLLAKEDEINRIQSMKILDEMLTSLDDADKQIGRILKTYGFGFSSGLINSLNDIGTFFNRNTTMTSQEYADMYFLSLLATVEYTKPLDPKILEVARLNGTVDEGRYQELKGLTNLTNADLLYAEGKITSVERDGWRMLAENESYQSFVSKIEGSKVLGASEGDALTTVYGAASTVGRQSLSVALSYVTAGAGAPVALSRAISSIVMFMQTYGSSYKQGIRSGASELNSDMFALLSSGTEVCFELVLGGIKGLAIGDDIIDAAVDIKKATSYIDILKYSAIDFLESTGKEIGEETLQEILGMVLANQYLNEPFNLTEFGENYLEFVMSVIISTNTMNAPSNIANISAQTVDYIKFGKNDQISFQVGKDQYINFTGDELRSMMDSEGNMDSKKLSESIKNKLTNQEFSNTPTATVVKTENNQVEKISEQDEIETLETIVEDIETLEKTDKLPVIQEIETEVESLEKTDKLPIIQEIENEVETFEIFDIEEDNVAYAPIEEPSNTIDYNQALQNDGLEPIVFSFEDELLTKPDSNLIVEYLNKSYLPNSIKLLLAETLSNEIVIVNLLKPPEKSARFKLLNSVKNDIDLCTEIIKTLKGKEKIDALVYVKNDLKAFKEIVGTMTDEDKARSLAHIKNNPETCKEIIKTMTDDASKAKCLKYIVNDIEAIKEIIRTMTDESKIDDSLVYIIDDQEMCKELIRNMSDESCIQHALSYIQDDKETCIEIIEKMTDGYYIANALKYIKSDIETVLEIAKTLSDDNKLEVLEWLKKEDMNATIQLALTINSPEEFVELISKKYMANYKVDLIRERYSQYGENTKKKLIYCLPLEEIDLKYEIFATLGIMAQIEVISKSTESEKVLFYPLYEKNKAEIDLVIKEMMGSTSDVNQRIMQNKILGTELNFDYNGAKKHVDEVFDINGNCAHIANDLNMCIEYFENYIRTKPEYANYQGNVVKYYLESLPDSMKNALKIYTGNSYREINNKFTRLYNGEIDDKNDTLTTNDGKTYLLKDLVYEIDNFLSQNKLKEDIILYRGVDYKDCFVTLGITTLNDLEKLNSGTIYQPEYGFISATALSDGGFTTIYDVNLVIRVKEGTCLSYIEPISSCKNEQEVLVQRNCIYHYTGVEKVTLDGKTKYYVYAELEPMTDEIIQALKSVNIDNSSDLNVENIND